LCSLLNVILAAVIKCEGKWNTVINVNISKNISPIFHFEGYDANFVRYIIDIIIITDETIIPYPISGTKSKKKYTVNIQLVVDDIKNILYIGLREQKPPIKFILFLKYFILFKNLIILNIYI
jgi:hypothetical protein